MEIPPPTRLKMRNIPWEHDGATQLALLTCFILRFFYEQATSRIGAAHVWNVFNKLPRAGRENYMNQKVGRLCVHVHILSACLPLRHWSLYAIGFQGEGRQNPGSSHVRAPSGPLCMGMGRFNIKSFNYLQANEIPYFPPKNHNTLTRGSQLGPCPSGTIALDPTFESFTLLQVVSNQVRWFLW